MGLPYANLSTEQRYFVDTVFTRQNVLIDACIGSGKTTAIQTLCDTLPSHLSILYLTYNKLLKVDARQKIRGTNILVTNYHGFVYPHLQRAGIHCGISDAIANFNKAKLPLPKYDIMIIDEYQDIELDFAEMLEYIKSTNPDIQIVFVGDMAQKIYDKTTLKVEEWARNFMGTRIELEFTQCFRISKDHAAMLGRVWGKTINGVNPICKIEIMSDKDISDFIAMQTPGNILCLGAKTGQMSKTLNILEKYYPDRFNKNTVYATIQ
jgi:nucleoside-triphosphatase THEP1